MSPNVFSLTLKPWFQDPAFVTTALAQRWVTQAQINTMIQALQDAFTGPDAFFALTFCAAVGFVPEA